jgi:hypothetical protein
VPGLRRKFRYRVTQLTRESDVIEGALLPTCARIIPVFRDSVTVRRLVALKESLSCAFIFKSL